MCTARGRAIIPTLRRSVVFGRHDLTRDPPISRVDIVVCRNTLMYLNAETKAYVLPRLQYALREGGYLFLGRAEMVLGGGTGRFSPVSLKHRIFVALPHHLQAGPFSSAFVERRPFDLAAPVPLMRRRGPVSAPLRPGRAAGRRGRDPRGRRPDRDGGQRCGTPAPGARRPGHRSPVARAPVASRPLDLVTPARQAIADGSSRDLGSSPYDGLRWRRP